MSLTTVKTNMLSAYKSINELEISIDNILRNTQTTRNNDINDVKNNIKILEKDILETKSQINKAYKINVRELPIFLKEINDSSSQIIKEFNTISETVLELGKNIIGVSAVMEINKDIRTSMGGLMSEDILDDSDIKKISFKENMFDKDIARLSKYLSTFKKTLIILKHDINTSNDKLKVGRRK